MGCHNYTQEDQLIIIIGNMIAGNTFLFFPLFLLLLLLLDMALDSICMIVFRPTDDDDEGEEKTMFFRGLEQIVQ